MFHLIRPLNLLCSFELLKTYSHAFTMSRYEQNTHVEKKNKKKTANKTFNWEA